MKRKIGILGPILAGLGALGATAISAPPQATISTPAAAAQGAQIQAAHGAQPTPVRQAPGPSHTLRLAAPAEYFGGGGYIPRQRGMTPKEWGMSAACRRMVRKNKLRRIRAGQRF